MRARRVEAWGKDRLRLGASLRDPASQPNAVLSGVCVGPALSVSNELSNESIPLGGRIFGWFPLDGRRISVRRFAPS
eukprot:11221879-Lingulodinium_polyedra.AAC.1